MTRSRTTASLGVESMAARTRAHASAPPTSPNASVRVTIGRAGNGRNSNPPRPDFVNRRTTNPFVSGASANDVRSTEPA